MVDFFFIMLRDAVPAVLARSVHLALRSPVLFESLVDAHSSQPVVFHAGVSPRTNVVGLQAWVFLDLLQCACLLNICCKTHLSSAFLRIAVEM